MTSQQFILAIMSTSNGASYSPVKIQKLFFLLDKQLGKKVGGPYFNFRPYHYGPFDKNLYHDIKALRDQRLIEIDDATLNSPRIFRLTEKGQELGELLIKDIKDKNNLGKIKELDAFVRNESFRGLVSYIYKEYPEMQANSIFE